MLSENNNYPVVGVLLSTYNGEKYIQDQIDSIFNQEDVTVKLFVRDDGSTDGTLGILREYSKQHQIEIIDDGESVRPGESFMRLVYKYADVPGLDYFAFADQDDIWLKDKLAVAIESINKYSPDKPVLYSSNQFLYMNGVNSGCRYNHPQPTDLISHLTSNTISGCTFVFNKRLAKLVSDSEHADQRITQFRLHDAWVMLVAIVCGEVIYDETPHILYRIHQNNTVGIKGISTKQRLDRLQRLFKKRYDSNSRMITAQQLLRSFPDIKDSDRKVLLLYSNYQKSLKDKLKLACNRQILKDCAEVPFVFFIKVMINFV